MAIEYKLKQQNYITEHLLYYTMLHSKLYIGKCSIYFVYVSVKHNRQIHSRRFIGKGKHILTTKKHS